MKQGYIMLEDKLQGEYKEAFQQVEMYSSTNLIGVDADSELMMELLDHMLTAQEAGQPVSDIVGEDIKLFCKNFFSEYTVGDRFIDFLKGVYRIAWILFVFELIDLIFPEDKGGLLGSSDIGCVLIGAACGMVLNVVVYVLIRPLIRKSKKIKPLAFNIFFTVLLIGTMALAGVFANRYSIMVPRWISLLIPAVYIICFMLVKARNNYKKYGTVKAPKQDSVSFKASVKASIEEELPGDWLKEFEKKNAKRVKKGKAPLAEAEFLEKLDKQYNYRKNSMINYSIFGGCTIVAIVAMAIDGFETVLDFIIFTIIMVVIEGSMCYFITKSAKVCSRVYHTMRKTMEEENLTLPQYVERYQKSVSQTVD